MRYVVAITGASGSRYGLRLVEVLLKKGFEVHFLIFKAGEEVLKFEDDLKLEGKTCKDKEAFFRDYFGSQKLFFMPRTIFLPV